MGRGRAAGRLAAITLLLAGILLLASRAQGEVELYRAKHRPPGELAGLAGPLLAPDGSATADPASGVVLLKGDPDAIRQAVEALEALDVPLRQYRIESEWTTHTALRARNLSVEGWIRVGDVRIGRLPRDDDSGLEVRARALRADSSRRLATQLSVLEGREGVIWTGQDVPVSTRIFQSDRFGDLDVVETTRLIPVRRGLRVRARSVGPEGERIDLELEPILQSGRPEAGGIQTAGAATRIQVRPGEWAVIGSLSEDDDRALHDWLGATGTNRAGSDSLLLIRATRTH